MSGVAVIILAAGTSSRLGRPKQLLPLDGMPIVTHVALAADESRAQRVFCVLGAHAKDVRSAVGGVVGDFVTNEAYEEGQGTSIAAPIGYLDILAGLLGRMDAVLYLLADQPGISTAAIDAVISAWQAGNPLVMARYDDGPGHPVLFDRRYWDELEALEGHQGGKDVIRRHASEVTYVDIPGNAPLDVDTEADWRRLQEWWVSVQS